MVTRLMGAPVAQPLTMNEERLATAVERLESVDVVGLTEDFGRFLDRAGRLLDVDLTAGLRERVGRPAPVSDALRRRLAADNELDLELYDQARRLVERRGG